MKLLLSLFLFVSCNVAVAKTVPDEQAMKAREPIADFLARHVYQVSGISEDDFNAGIDLVYNHYAAIVQAKGYQLVFNRAWSDSTVNSDTTLNGKTWLINSYGGLARYSGMTKNGYTYVACHELGHHFGKAPIYTNEDWSGYGAAVEGEADYWASICMKEIGFGQQEIEDAAQSMGNVLASLGGEPMPSPNKPSTVVVNTTVQSHPRAQIRLDTYLAGMRCKATGEFSQQDPRVNTCYYYPNGIASPGSRPRSWFAPKDQGSPEPGGTNPPPPPPPGPTPTPNPTCPPQRVCPPPVCPAPGDGSCPVPAGSKCYHVSAKWWICS